MTFRGLLGVDRCEALQNRFLNLHNPKRLSRSACTATSLCGLRNKFPIASEPYSRSIASTAASDNAYAATACSVSNLDQSWLRFSSLGNFPARPIVDLLLQSRRHAGSPDISCARPSCSHAGQRPSMVKHACVVSCARVRRSEASICSPSARGSGRRTGRRTTRPHRWSCDTPPDFGRWQQSVPPPTRAARRSAHIPHRARSAFRAPCRPKPRRLVRVKGVLPVKFFVALVAFAFAFHAPHQRFQIRIRLHVERRMPVIERSAATIHAAIPASAIKFGSFCFWICGSSSADWRAGWFRSASSLPRQPVVRWSRARARPSRPTL